MRAGPPGPAGTRGAIMARTDYVTLDASAAGGVNFNTYIAEYFAALSNGGTSFYGGEPDSASLKLLSASLCEPKRW